MTWYAASAVFLFEFIEGVQDSHFVWENVYVFSASSIDEAHEKAEKYAKQHEENNENGKTTLNDRPVRIKYKGLRKLMTFQMNDEETNPLEGAEATYYDFEFSSQEDFLKYLDGEDVNVCYQSQVKKDN